MAIVLSKDPVNVARRKRYASNLLVNREKNRIKRKTHRDNNPEMYKRYQAAYHPGWVEKNREDWNTYQKRWRRRQELKREKAHEEDK
jgi:hypothetical protein